MSLAFKRSRLLRLVLLSALAFYSCQTNSQAVQEVVHEEKQSVSKVFTTADLAPAFMKDSRLVDTLKGHQIMVSGYLSDISPDNYRVLLRDSNGRHGVVCVLKDTSLAKELHHGDQLIFKGTFIGNLGAFVHLQDCILISTKKES